MGSGLQSDHRAQQLRTDSCQPRRRSRIQAVVLSTTLADQHRSAKAQLHLTMIRARAGLVSARTALVNAARGLAKSYGERLPGCGTQKVNRELAAGLSTELREALEPLLREVESLNERIKEYDRWIDEMAKETYPEAILLKQVKGVRNLIALAFVLTIEDPHRFRKSRYTRVIGTFGLAGNPFSDRTFGSAESNPTPVLLRRLLAVPPASINPPKLSLALLAPFAACAQPGGAMNDATHDVRPYRYPATDQGNGQKVQRSGTLEADIDPAARNLCLRERQSQAQHGAGKPQV